MIDSRQNGKHLIKPLHPCFPVKTQFDGVTINSVASFLIALTIENAKTQSIACGQVPENVATLAARTKGLVAAGKSPEMMYWRGVPIHKSSLEYDNLLDRLLIKIMEDSPSIKSYLEESKEDDLNIRPRDLRLIGHLINREDYSRRLKALKAGARPYANA